MMDIQPQHEHIVKNILRQHMPEVVYAFGSRVALTAKPHSDLDLVIVGEGEMPIQRMHLLGVRFVESQRTQRAQRDMKSRLFRKEPLSTSW